MDKIQSIYRGMTKKELQSSLQKNPIWHFKINNDNNLYLIEIYPMQTGSQTSYYPDLNLEGVILVDETPTTSDYIFIIKNEKLLFWGFINELYKSKDKEILKLEPIITEKLQNSNLGRWFFVR